MKTDYRMLYLMDDPLANQPIRLEPYENDWLGRREAVGLLRGQIAPRRALRLRPAMGARFVDLLWCTFTPIRVISTALLNKLLSNGITGWGTYEVELQNRDGQLEADYCGLAILGRAGNHDLQRVEQIQKPPITKRGTPYIDLKGLYFKNDDWDGNDFCLVGDSIMVAVTKRVVEVFAHSRIRNVRFTPLPDVEIPLAAYEATGLWPPN
jgi:hypothetical protein